jgi:putative pyruvate formate lyase activating enzyme
VDIYLPDFKFTDPETARRFTFATDYPEIARGAIREMHRQVGDFRLDESGMAERGLLVRHLVLPNDTGGVRELMRFLRDEISADTCVSLMGSYVPPVHLLNSPPLDRRPTRDEYLEAVRYAREAGLRILGDSGRR